ncbi:MAG: hypothetical protein MUF39_05530 [Cyclobacteriaceae bacterium]|nr:hypothetical protein [Cyclobacteriaceae bacterium]
MLLDRDGQLEMQDLPEVLTLMQNHSKAGIAAILSEKKGLITDVDITKYLQRCKWQLLSEMEKLENTMTREEAWDLAMAINDFFDHLGRKG